MHYSREFTPIILTNYNKPWEKVLHLGTACSFNAKTIIPAEDFNSPNTGAYYIKKGRVRLSCIADNGMEKVLLYMDRGMFFNEIPMLHLTRGSIFTCMEKISAVFFHKKFLNIEFAREYPELMMNLIESITIKSLNFSGQLSDIGIFSSFINVCRTFYSMHLFNQENGKVVPKLTQLELSAFLGIHRSSLHKAISRLKDEGVIDNYKRDELKIFNIERLIGYATGKIPE